MFIPPVNNIVVTVTTKYIKNYSNIMKAANLNPANTLNPLDLVQIVGEVVALPKTITTNRRGYEGFTLKDIEVGDTAIFSYQVIGELTQREYSDVPLYKNMVFYKGKEYFLCNILNLFAVVKKESGSIKMLNGFCMITDVEEEGKIFIPQYQSRFARSKQATVTNIGNPMEGEQRPDIFPGQKVLVDTNKISNYQVNEKKFSIVKTKYIFGAVEE